MLATPDDLRLRGFGELPTQAETIERMGSVLDTLPSRSIMELYEGFARILEGSHDWFVVDEKAAIMKTALSAEERLAGIGLALFQPARGPAHPFPSLAELEATTGLSDHDIAREIPSLISHALLLVRLPSLPEKPEDPPRRRAKAPIPPELRWRVWQRDNFTCLRCGSREFLTIDHIHPESLGGATMYVNLQTLCRSCNSSKGARMT